MDELLAKAEKTSGKKISLKDVEQKQSVLDGFLWLNSLLKFKINMKCEKCGHINSSKALDGKADLVRSFAKVAKESRIKGIIKPKKAEPDKKFERKKATEKRSLF